MSADYSCRDCHHAFEAPSDMGKRLAYKCPKCGSKNWGLTPTVVLNGFRAPKDMFWENENKGRGRYIGGLGKRSDPNAYCRSLNEATEKAKKLGKSYEIG